MEQGWGNKSSGIEGEIGKRRSKKISIREICWMSGEIKGITMKGWKM